MRFAVEGHCRNLFEAGAQSPRFNCASASVRVGMPSALSVALKSRSRRPPAAHGRQSSHQFLLSSCLGACSVPLAVQLSPMLR